MQNLTNILKQVTKILYYINGDVLSGVILGVISLKETTNRLRQKTII